MNHLALKSAAVSLAGLGAAAALAVPAHADSTIVQVNKTAHLSATHKIMLVNIKVTCSEDTTSAALSAQVDQVTSGGAQEASGAVISLGAFECSGEEETVTVPVRRPTGGFKWTLGSARISHVVFITDDPEPGVNVDFAKGRTVLVK